jgi:hypothetical protein
MNILEAAVNMLRRHNRWRRGDETVDAVDPALLGCAIDTVCDHIEVSLGMAPATNTDADGHSCSYHCDRPECIRRQRDELRIARDRLTYEMEGLAVAATNERMVVEQLRAKRDALLNSLRLVATFELITGERPLDAIQHMKSIAGAAFAKHKEGRGNA